MALTLDIPRLETPRLIMRAPQNDDFEAEAEFYSSEHSHFVGGPMSAGQAWRTLASMIGHWVMRGFGFWALEAKETRIYLGRVGLWFPYDWPEKEVGWTLMPAATGKGYATEAALAARDYAYDVLGWDTAISLIAPENKASQAVATRLGATFDYSFEHESHGPMHIWRHPAPNTVSSEGKAR